MNWYKKISKIIEQPNISYVDIGHENFPVCIWVWDFPNDFQKKCWEEQPSKHSPDYFVGHSQKNIWSDQPYMGRFDFKTKRVSIDIASKFRLREIPELLLERLYREFGPDIRIYVYK